MGTDPEDNGEGHVEEFDESPEFDPEDIVTIQDEEGNEIECAILMIIEHDGDDYAMLGPLEQLRSEEGDEIEMYIFKYQVDDEGNQLFAAIEDDRTYEAVRTAFSLLMDQE